MFVLLFTLSNILVSSNVHGFLNSAFAISKNRIFNEINRNIHYFHVNDKMTTDAYNILDAECWDDGEVIWDFSVKNSSDVQVQNMMKYQDQDQDPNNIQTPLSTKIELDQTKIASISTLVKTTYKQVFDIETMFSDIQSFNQGNIPLDALMVSIAYTTFYSYIKIKEIEKKRMEKLYKNYTNKNYVKRYLTLKRAFMMFVLSISIVFTKNVHFVE